jgi:hypothetical protein
MQYRIKMEWKQEDGSIATAELGQVECGRCQSAADVGLKLADAKSLAGSAATSCGKPTAP